MANPYIKILLDDDERRALFRLATAEKRPAPDQAAFLIRRGLEAIGLIEPEPPLPVRSIIDQEVIRATAGD